MKCSLIVVCLIAAWSNQLSSQEIRRNGGGESAIREIPRIHERGQNWFDEVEGALWARGDDFKASFSSEAVSFIPFLGADAPRNFPVTFRIESVRAGGKLLDLAKVEPARREGNLISIDRGALIEQYAVAPTQVEQLFHIEKSPGPGALVVKIAVETELGVSRTPEGVLEFANDRGGVRYGRPEVVDAGGRHAAMESAWHDGAVELTIPEAFLKSAVFPVTIDPSLVTFAILGGGPNFPTMDYNADVAYDVTFDRFAMVYEEVYSASDHDVFVRVFDTLASTVSTAYVDFTTSFWAAPKIASNQVAIQCLVVAEKTLSGGAVVIFGRTLQVTNPIAMGAQFQISGSELGIKSHPDVGGDPSPYSPSYYCVCWQSTINSNKNVYYNLVQANNGLVFGVNPSPFVGYTSLNTNSKPSISKSDGNSPSTTQDWIIVFQSTYSPTDEDIYGAVVHWDGTLVNTGFAIDTSTRYEANPSVSSVTDYVGTSRRWLTVYEKLNPGNPPLISPEYDVYGMLFSSPTTFVTQANLTTLLGAIAWHDQTHACVDSDGTRFTLGFTDSGGFSDLGTPYLATVHVAYGTSLGVTEPPVSVNGYPGLDDNLQITSKRSGGGLQYRYMAVHDVQSTTNAGHDVLGAYYDGWSPVASGGPSAYLNYALPGCNGVSLLVQGFPAIGLGLSVTLSGVQGVGYIGYGVPASPITLCSGCLLGLDPNTVTIFQTTSLSGAIPLEGGLVNVSIAIQGADLGSPNGCPGSPPISLSDCVIVTIL